MIVQEMMVYVAIFVVCGLLRARYSLSSFIVYLYLSHDLLMIVRTCLRYYFGVVHVVVG